MITVMTALEAIPKISELLTRLIKLTKDKETGALVQQIQQHQLEIHTALVVADAKIRDLERQLAEAQAEEVRIHSSIDFRWQSALGVEFGWRFVRSARCQHCLRMIGMLLAVRIADGHPAFPSRSCHASPHSYDFDRDT